MDGILIVDKPQGMTSHDVVDFIRKTFGVKKVGHAGTLDPMATGLLVMLIGAATKSADRFLKDNKDYEGSLMLGGRSDTGDAWGKIVFGNNDVSLGAQKIKEAFSKFLGHIEQTPPAYSAVKIKGRKSYELARKGIKPDLKARKIFIEKFCVTGVSVPEVSFQVTCSKGTYVRQLCVDIGDSLGCGAYLSRLRRTRSGAFSIDESVSVNELTTYTKADLAGRLRNT
jgi:tRNA pseudouridine55 synthase